MSTAPSPVELDALDHRLIDILRVDGRARNRTLADRLAVTEATVAARIRRLSDAGVLTVTAIFDWEAAGFAWSVLVAVEVEDRPPSDVGRELAAIPEVHGVSLVFGDVDLVLNVRAPDRRRLRELLAGAIRAVPGVRAVSTNVELEVVHYQWGLATRPRAGSPSLEFPAPVVALDELDEAIVAELVRDGRQSNRQIARQLDVADGTVRTRLRRLEEAKLLRIVGETDPVAAGTVGAIGFVAIEVEGAHALDVARALARLPELVMCSITAGRHDVIALAAAPDQPTLVDLVTRRIRGLGGVRRTETWTVLEVLKHAYHWVRLLD